MEISCISLWEVVISNQVGALPYRFDDRGNVEVMLITSRTDRQHWMPPKGNLVAGLAPHVAAAREAFEEAGLVGRISPEPLGDYEAVKSRPNGRARPLNITLFPLCVEDRVRDWPEKGQRAALWFELRSAASVVREPRLAEIITHFTPPSQLAA